MKLYFQTKNISWERCIGICTDGAVAMTGKHRGLVTCIKEISHPDLIITHCFLHREQLATKDMCADLHDILNQCVQTVNYIRKSALNMRLFRLMCDEMGSAHKNLLLHSHIRWLSRGRVLSRLFELRVEIEIFLNDQKPTVFSEYFKSNVWLSKVAYLADIFSLINDLTLSLQGCHTNLFICYNKMEAFIKKIELWFNRVRNNCFDMFPLFSQMVEDKMITHDEISGISKIIQDHLLKLKEKFFQYFPPTEDIRFKNMWILNPFQQHHSHNLNLSEEEKLIELSANKSLELKFKENQKNLPKFWLEVQDEYPILSEKAIKLLLPFATTYLAESGFSTMIVTKNKFRNRLDVSSTMRLALTNSIGARIDKLIEKKQQQQSH